MEEYIGKVKLNLDYYSGSDLYSDGTIEDEILEIVKNNSRDNYDKIIMEKGSWPVFYHLTDIRENIINWYPIESDAEVLEIGAGCGAISGILADKAGKVTAIDLSKKRSTINAYKNQDKDNLEIIVGNFNDIALNLEKKFDYITLIGVFEYAKCYIDEKNAVDVFLEKISNLLKANGKLVIAIENQMGLKYFAGCKEDHVGKYFEGIEGYTTTEGVETYSKKKITEILQRNGYNNLYFYYPYPDYKLPEKIFSDDYLPKKGELIRNQLNMDAERLILFDESKVFNQIIDAGLFQEHANSFLIIANKVK